MGSSHNWHMKRNSPGLTAMYESIGDSPSGASVRDAAEPHYSNPCFFPLSTPASTSSDCPLLLTRSITAALSAVLPLTTLLTGVHAVSENGPSLSKEAHCHG